MWLTATKLAAISDHLMLFPMGTDVQSQDRILSVTNRRGKVLVSQKLRVIAAVPRETHLEVSLEKYS